MPLTLADPDFLSHLRYPGPGADSGPEGGSLPELFARWLSGKGLSHRTCDEYRKWVARADRWLKRHVGVPLEQARPDLIRMWVDADVPNSWSSRKQARTALAHWCRFAHHQAPLPDAVPVPRKPKMRPRALPDVQTARLEHAAWRWDGREGATVMLGLYLGMRRTEIAQAGWTSDGGDEWVWTRSKTGDVAALPVHPRLRQVLDRLCRCGPYLFDGSRGRPHVSPTTVWEWVRKVGETVDVDVTTHQLRHCAITRVVESHGIRVGQEFAGHRDPEVTAGYSRVKQRTLREAVTEMSWNDRPVWEGEIA